MQALHEEKESKAEGKHIYKVTKPECELGRVAPTTGQHCPQPEDLTCQKGGCTSPLHSCQ